MVARQCVPLSNSSQIPRIAGHPNFVLPQRESSLHHRWIRYTYVFSSSWSTRQREDTYTYISIDSK